MQNNFLAIKYSSELSISDTTMAKGIAILFMLFLHLFANNDLQKNYDIALNIFDKPLIYYIAVFCSCCVPIYFFLSGYALYLKYEITGKVRKFGLVKLMINYWTILLLTCLTGYFFGISSQIPGSITKFLLNFFIIGEKYSGVWWFIQTYVILVVLTPFIFKIVKNSNSLFLLIISGFIYFLSFIIDVKSIFIFDNNTINEIRNAILLLSTSQFSFVVGAIFYKNRVFSKIIINRGKNTKMKNIIISLLILLEILLTGYTEQYIIRPLSGILFLCLFYMIDLAPVIKNVFSFFGKHSTNIWLTHMLIYATFIPQIVFFSKSPIVVYLWLIILSLMTSFLVNIIYKPLLGFVSSWINSPTQRVKAAQ